MASAQQKNDYKNQTKIYIWMQWLKPITLATWEADIGRFTIRDQNSGMHLAIPDMVGSGK
jgi:hypothetical protein